MKKFVKILSALLAVLTVLSGTAVTGFAAESESVSKDFITEISSDIIETVPNYPKIGEPIKILVQGRESEKFFYSWFVNGAQINNFADTYTPVEDDMNKTVTVKVYDSSGEFVGLKNIFISNIPVIYIETEAREAIVVKEKNLKAKMSIQGNDEFSSEDVLYNGDIQIKGRGNSTWKYYDKKPYKIKLDSKSDLFGMGKNKHWVLLSNPADKSNLRNDIAYQLSGKMGLGYQDGTWVELILNGKDVGIYYIAEHIRVGSTRTDITDWESVAEDAAKAIYKKNKNVISKDQSGELTDLMIEDLSWTTSDKFTYNGVEYTVSDYYDVPDINGGYLLELTSLAEEPKITTAKKVELEVNTPETVSDDMKASIASYVQAFEDALYSDDFCTEYNGRRTRYTELIDIDSFAKGVILNEMFQNSDFAYRSTYFYKDIDGRLFYGPVWDMDACLNNNADAWFSRIRPWMERLYQDPVFMKALRDIYWEYRYTDIYDILKPGGKIDAAYSKIHEASVHNDKLWSGDVDFEENVADYRFRLQDKIDWMDSALATLESSYTFAEAARSSNVSLSFKDGVLGISATGIEPTGFSVFVNGEFSQSIDKNSDLNNINVAASDDDIISVVAYSGGTPVGGNYICNQNYITSLSVAEKPAKTVYSAGDSIDLTGLKLKATYKDGSTAFVNPDTVYTMVTDSLDAQLFCCNRVTEKCGSAVLVLVCGPKSVSIPLTVNPKEDYELVEQYISKIPTDTESTEFVKYTAEAWEQYEALSESAKAKVNNYKILSDAIGVLNSGDSLIVDCYHSAATRDNARNNIVIAVKAPVSAVTFSYGTSDTMTTFKKSSSSHKLIGLKTLGGIEFWTVRRGLVASNPEFEVTVKNAAGAEDEKTYPSSKLFNLTQTVSGVAYPDCIFENEEFNITFNYSDDISKVKLVENGNVLAETKDLHSGIPCKFDTVGNHNVTVYYLCGGRWFEYKSFDIFVRETVEERHVSKSDHLYIAKVTKPTCKEEGYTTYTCLCGDSYKADYVEKLDHTYGDWKMKTPPTCEDKGVKIRRCTGCTAYETGELEALGHNYGGWKLTTPATCTENGVETRYCTRCDSCETRKTELAAHSYKAVVTKPTCTAKGYTTYTCSCGDSYKADYVDKLGHSYGEWKITTPATCENKGEKTRYCTRCDAYETEETGALGHSYTAVATKPTCTEKGYTTYTCHCGDSYKADYVDKLGHSYGEWKVTTPATCTKEGVKTRYCTRCDAYETGKISATGHSYTAVVTKPTCTEKGYTTYTCHCGDSYKADYVEKLGHSYGEWKVTTPATCTKNGVETRYCIRCDAYETRKTDLAPHSYKAVVTKPTCKAEGYTTYTCHCGDSYKADFVAKLDHTYGEWKVKTAPTCEDKGVKIRRCTGCTAYETGELEALGHNYGEWKVTTPATCDHRGEKTRYCSRCDAYETEETGALGHDYNAVVTKPTCTQKGYTTYTCDCGDSYKADYVDKLGHSYGEWKVTTPATCTKDGVKTRYCTRCDACETGKVSATGHSYTSVVTKPTCTQKGYTTYTCHCGDSYIADYVDAAGHIDGEWKVTKSATYTSEGEKTLYCKECGEVIRTDIIPKLYGRVVSVSIENVEVRYKKSAVIKPEIKTEGGIGYTVKYETSDPTIVTVDQNGSITTHHKGTAKITCTVTDEAGNTVKDTRTINVRFSFGQWLIWIFLFGFLWY